MNRVEYDALQANLLAAARDIGRLRRLTTPETSAWWALDRIAQAVETIDCVLCPSAGELYREYIAISGDDALSLEEALRDVDKHAKQLRELLDGPEREQTLRAVA